MGLKTHVSPIHPPLRSLHWVCRVGGKMSRPRWRGGLVGVLLCSCSIAWGQKPPQVGYVYPPVVKAGTTATVQFGGYDFTPDLQWFVHHPRVTLTTSGELSEHFLTPPPYWTGPRAGVSSLPIPREVAAQISVAADTPAGLVRWQVANANGVSQTAVFFVSRGEEILESRSRDLPQRLPALPIAVSGRLSRLTEVDRYEFVATTDGLISIDLMARRLGSNFHGMLQVHDAAGRILANFSDTAGRDGGVTFPVRQGETYSVLVHDADFRGDRSYVYRLALFPGPQVLATLPATGQRGTTADVEFVGWGIATGTPQLEALRQRVDFPTEPTLLGHTHRLQTSAGTVEVTIPLGDGKVLARPAAGGLLDVPCAVTDVLSAETRERRFSWQVVKDEFWQVDLQSMAIGGGLDVAVSILGPDEKQIAENDDLPGTTDAGLEFKAPADGVVTCVVRSVGITSGSLTDLFQLTVQRSQPGFTLTMPQQATLVLGGKTQLAIQAIRSGGFHEEIDVQIQGLPNGVTVTGDWKIAAGKKDLKGTLEATTDADVVAVPLQITGTSQLEGQTLVRTASATWSGNLAPSSSADQQTSIAVLAVTMAPPFEIQLIDRTRQREVPRGSACLAEMDIVRQPGFEGEILLEMAGTQARYLCGSRGLPVRVPPEQTRAIYPAWMSEWLSTDLTMRMATHGVAQIPDPKGRPRYLVKGTDAPITMIMEGALLKLTLPPTELSLRPGASFEIPCVVSRSPKLPLPVTVSLRIPEELEGLIESNPLVLAPDTDRALLKITTHSDSRLLGMWNFTVEAHATQDEQWPVKSYADTSIEFRSDP